MSASCSKRSTTRNRQQHHRCLHDRQRAEPVVMAGRCDDAVPQREGYQLGRRFPCAGNDPLAGPHQGRRSLQRDRLGLDWFPTLLAAAGDTDIKERLLNGANVGGKTFKVHLDGYNQLPYLTGQQPKSARNEFYYFNDDGNWSPIATTTGRSCFASSGSRADSRFGQIRLRACAHQGLQPADGSRSNGRTSSRTSITTGWPRTPTCCSTAMAGGAVPSDLQGLSAKPAAGELQHRPDGSRD